MYGNVFLMRIIMNLNKQHIDKAYVSEHDLFLHRFDKEHPQKSKSQLKEIEKHKKIFALRDGAVKAPSSSFIKRVLRVFFS